MSLKKLSDLPEGRLAEIIEIENESLMESFGAHVGMTAMVLRQAVESVVQIGLAQIEMPRESMRHILVKEL